MKEVQTYQVVTQQLHDQGGILIALLAQRIEFCRHLLARFKISRTALLTSNSIVKCLLGQMARLVGRIENLVVEHREVESQSQTDRMGRGKLRLRHLGGRLVSLEGLVGRVLALVTDSELGKVAVVVTLPGEGISRQLMRGIRGTQTSCGKTPLILQSSPKG